jgi:hypothetical protein
MPADPAAGEFPVASCTACDREVLCHLDLDAGGGEMLRCLECGGEIERACVRWLDLAGIEELGYGFVLPDAGCGRPDCGGGRCGRSAPEDESPV